MTAVANQVEKQQAIKHAYIALGSNLGDSLSLVQLALRELAQLPGTRLVQQSPLYRSKPLDADGADYVNGVALLHSQLSALELLAALQQIELRHGRERSYQNAPRTLDLDLLLYQDDIINLPQLQVPHPRMHLRAFVLRPLLDIAPEITLPQLGSAQDLLAQITDQELTLIPA